MKRARALLVFVLIAAGAAGGSEAARPRAAARSHYGDRPEVHQFIREMAQRHGFAESELRQVFGRVTQQPEILHAIRPPLSPRVRSWERYRAIFLNERHIAEGLRFLAHNAEALARAERQFGVPQEIIVAIIGIETFYGQNMGKWRVIDALATLAFDYPPRAEFFRGELESYLLFVRESDLDMLGVRGSYAGAIGIPQFMPGSYRRWAVDYDGDGVPRLRSSPTDAIGSVANFLRMHGWVQGAPIAYPVEAGSADTAPLLAAGLKPSFSLAQLASAGITLRPEPAVDSGTVAALIELQTPDKPSEFRAGLENFYVITRYNRSSFYASAVFDLSEALRTERIKPVSPVPARN